MQSKSLVMIPFRFAIEMVNRGWILRNTIIWYKKSCMPSSVSDRFTIDFEYIFFFSKNQKYYFEQQFEEFKTKPHSPGNKNRIGTIADSNPKERYDDVWGNPQGRNKRTTWTINPKPFPDAHFAVFPPELCETPIKAGCPEYVCKKCGNPKIKVYKTIKKGTARDTSDYAKKLGRPDGGGNRTRGAITPNQRVPKGFESTCDCESDFIPGILLDPFSGAGSALLTARKLGRRFLGIEISQKYIDIAKKRLGSMGRDTNLDEFW
jgi:DNA modification methylase